MEYKRMATINDTYKRCVAENIGISKHLIRQLANSGTIPVVKAGRVTLINFDILMSYLDGDMEQRKETEMAGGIQPIPVQVGGVCRG